MSSLLDNRRWDVLPSNGEAEHLLCEKLDLAPLVARVLAARGITSIEAARRFLDPSLQRDWLDPLLIPGMSQAADCVETALRNGEQIAVFGDFDVDGMTSTCLLTQALRRFGGTVRPYIPHRFGEGYGLSRAALDRVLGEGRPDLIITVDNGIAAAREVAWLVEHGVDVVITDHHEPGDLVPVGVPVTDPKLSADCASRELAGAGVALKLVCELGKRLGQPNLWKEYVDLAALGTVSDMMLLQGENRSLVAEGIALMRHSNRPGIVALAATAGIDLASIQADTLPFSLIPRLNAAGRMGTTEVAFDLLIADDPAEAAVLAGMLERTNTERRETEASLANEALALAKRAYVDERVLVLSGEGWHEGVKGIVASRIVSQYHVPAIVFSITDGIARGSGRSVGTVDLFHAVEQCSDLLVRFGGHAGAVGVTCEVENLDAFRDRMQQVLASLPAERFEDRGEVAAIASLSELTREGIASLDVLQPFGQGNKRPLFGVQGVFMRNRARVGYEGTHLRFIATDGASSVPSIMFRAPNMDHAYACEGLVDLVVDAVNESWQGRTNPKLMVRDILYRGDAVDGDEQEPFADAAMLPSESHESSVPEEGPEVRASLSRLSIADLTERLRERMVGNSELLPAQACALELLARGESALCVMATGRGKSLIFHMHAARAALLQHKASVFVYPLRALVSDQAFHLERSFECLGLTASVLTGETPNEERRAVFEALAAGTVDVILTTPEFLAIHVDQFARTHRVGFVVVDEAHHAGMTQGGDRVAYAALPEVLHALDNPVALAVTATAPTPIAQEVCRLLNIDDQNVVVDETSRPNLEVVDHRDLRERDMLLTSIVSRGQKSVVYVNSRNQAESLVRTLRKGVPELGHAIAFYHAGLSRPLRLSIEHAFREGPLTCVVATSAFGEGVNLPDIRNVVLYHMPFGSTEFNQMSGRAGRDGAPACVHLLFGGDDARINERILEAAAPAREDMVTLYRALMGTARRNDQHMVDLSDDQILKVVQGLNGQCGLTADAVESGIGVFDELGFLQTQGFGDGRRLIMATSPKHVDLAESVRYSEGGRLRNEFAAFCDWALTTNPQEMLNRINKPIVPGFGRTVDR